MPHVGQFRAADLPVTGDLDGLAAALSRANRNDVSFVHSTHQQVAQTPQGLVRGVNLFGPGHSSDVMRIPMGIGAARGISTVVLNDAWLIADSMSILDRQVRLFRDGIENLADSRALAEFDPNFELDTQGRLSLSDAAVRDAEHLDCIALPICGLGFPNYGHFLYDGLPGVHLLAGMFSDLDIRIVGPRLSEWQRDVLSALGLARLYREVTRPMVFRKLLATTMLSMHVSYPTSFIRSSFERIRFGISPAPGPSDRRIYLSRRGDTTRRVLRNRAEVERHVTALGFEIVHTDHMSFRQQVQLMRSCRVVVGESGAAMANLGFCEPGACVMELQPERFTEGWTRAMCFLLAHRWHVYFAAVDSAPQRDDAGNPRDPNQFFSYEVDPQDLGQALLGMLARL